MVGYHPAELSISVVRWVMLPNYDRRPSSSTPWSSFDRGPTWCCHLVVARCVSTAGPPLPSQRGSVSPVRGDPGRANARRSRRVHGFMYCTLANFPLRAMIETLFQRQDVRGQGHKAKLTPEMYRSDQRMGVILKLYGRIDLLIRSLLLDVSCHWHIAYGAWYLPVFL